MTTLAGRYKVKEILGGGGFAITYLARDTMQPSKPLCVVKQLLPNQTHPRVIEFFNKEAAIQQHILIDILCSAPWNCLPEPLEETKKGAAPWLVADIIEEIISGSLNIRGIFKVAAVPRAIKAYKNMGFEENPDGSREMILTEKRALQFLEEYKNRWR